MNGVMNVANSPIMWAASAIAIGIVLWQAWIFYKKAWKTGIELGLSAETLKAAMKAAAITSFGPSVAVATGLLALITVVGSPMAWLRLGYVGALPYETLAVSLAVEACGLKMGVDTFGGTEFITICMLMTAGAFGYTVVATYFSGSAEKLQNKVIGNNTKLLGIVSSCALMSTIGAAATQHMMSIGPAFAAVIAAGVAMAILGTIANKKDILWLKEFSLFFSMLIGLAAAVIARG